MRQTELISSSDFLGPSLALLAVLLIFMVCVWAIKMLQKQTVHENDRLRIVSGLSLGMRERLVLVQAGKKQLILGVTPSRIDMLCLLEGDDCLQKITLESSPENSFAYKLKQVMKGKNHA
ncbi:MAG: flagellar biosynthetic protein FliO [Methylococcales bacterium]|jgi:flagellar protein FliO/FliZ|nr:flagellar biosynthetic protein FliO [Methylococcales bacterium]